MNTQDRPTVVAFSVVLGVILLIRLTSLAYNNSELFFDEAQYWFWAQDLDFGYFSKPPLLAWIIAATTGVCGNDSEFCVRLSAPLIHLGTSILVYLTAQRLFGNRVGFWAGTLFATLPAVSLSSTIISTDVPLLFFWSLALYAYVRLWETFDLRWAVLLGVAIGFGLNAKYAMAYFLGCALLHALVEQQKYTPARKGGFWVSVGIAATMMVPNGLWNIDHSFVTVSHTGDNIGWEGFQANWVGFGEFYGAQFGVFGPITFGVFLAAAFAMFKDSISDKQRFLMCFSLPILVVILFQAIISKAYANWAAATYVAATILVAEIMVNRINFGWMRTTMTIHGVVFLAIAVAVCFAAAGQLKLPGGIEPFKRNQGAATLAAETEKMLDAYSYNGLITTDRKLSSLMQYNLRDRPEAILAWSPGAEIRDHFQLAVPYQASPRDPALVISKYDNINAYAGDFKTAVHLGSRDIAEGEIKKIYFFRLEGHKSFD